MTKKLFFLIFAGLLFANPWKDAEAAPQKDYTYHVTVTATVGQPKLTIYGYTSPGAKVLLTGKQVADQTTADNDGYFIMEHVYFPEPKMGYPEVCLNAVDVRKRISFPTCLPRIPLNIPLEITVGPVLLPPTVSIGKNTLQIGEQVIAKGATFPNSDVIVSMANNEAGTSVLIKKANAFFLPKYETISNQSGEFELNLPSVRSSSWRVFATANFQQDYPSPKSNTLSFRVMNWWELVLFKIWLIVSLFLLPKNRYILILPAAILAIALMILFSKEKKKEKEESADSTESET